LFLNQEIFIGDRFNGTDFMVSRVEALPSPLFKEKMSYNLKSAVVLSVKGPDNKAIYLSPDDERYTSCFIKHLSEKFNTVLIARSQLREEITVDTEIPVGLKITSRFRSKLHTIKPDTGEQTRVRGFVYDFELTAPVEIHEMAYSAGFGEKNATGFGWAEVLK
jgi:CRISPR-associated endoribonuclease Cas6